MNLAVAVDETAELEASTYEVIRKRLLEQGDSLSARVETLNRRRQEIFGGAESALVSTEHVTTEHNCIPRDIAGVGERLLLGYQVFMGLKSRTVVSDVFAELTFGEDSALQATDLKLLRGEKFREDFGEIFHYYKDARLLQLRRMNTSLLAVFQTGGKPTDFKVLRWSITPDGLEYVDNRGERDHVFPPSHDFTWTRTGREDHVHGDHPHVNIADTLFVECVRGDLTIKVENNTATGAGIYSEPVDEEGQGLDDAEISYADLESCILLKVRPYREEHHRYIVFNKLSRKAVRIDAIGYSCQELPEGHGLIFSNGYYLQSGAHKMYHQDVADMEFFASRRAPNGEDIAYIYHHRDQGLYSILEYNMIRREVSQPRLCHGYSFFPDGRLVLFRADPEPSRVHAMQVWRTPFISPEFANLNPAGDGSFLGKVGNRDLVHGISELLQICRLVRNLTPNLLVYEDLLRRLQRALDGHHWLGHAEAGDLAAQLVEIQKTANAAIDEFEKVTRLKEEAARKVAGLVTSCEEIFRTTAGEERDGVESFVRSLTSLRAERGRIESLRGVRYVDGERLDALEQRIVETSDTVSAETVEFLLQDSALEPYRHRISELQIDTESLEKTSEADHVASALAEVGGGLDLLMGIVNGLEVEDATARTAILERLSEVYAFLNRAKALLASRRKEIGARETGAEFAVQFKLLTQSASNYLGLCDAPEKCDEFLGKLLLEIEEIESAVVAHEEFVDKLAEKRQEIYETFQARKQALLDERQRHATTLARGAERILKSVTHRAATFESLDELNSFFATDPMVAKLREVAKRLRDLEDTVKADEVESRLKSARENAARNVRDKTELFDGDGLVKMGRHSFSVNSQELELTMLPRDGGMCFHLTGTGYYEEVSDEEFSATRAFWTQELPSEDETVYRSEYLAYEIWRAAENGQRSLSIESLAAAVDNRETLLEEVRKFSAERYDEGYERGVHDHDAALILEKLVPLRQACGLLRFSPRTRALAVLYWSTLADRDLAESLRRQCRSLDELRRVFGEDAAVDDLAAELSDRLRDFARANGLFSSGFEWTSAGRYLVEELGSDGAPQFVLGGEATRVLEGFRSDLERRGCRERLESSVEAFADDLPNAYRVVSAWVRGFVAEHCPDLDHLSDEVVASILSDGKVERRAVAESTTVTVGDLLGQHPRVDSKRLTLRLEEFLERVARFADERVPAFRAFLEKRRNIVEREREALRLEEFRPRVLTSFVRNRLINEVYLPLIGDNLAKQIGVVGDRKRTDLMGLLLLISPPGYGKTTLMEYVASILGLTFMKINGPAIGHDVRSLDPGEAGNGTARQELVKLNLALEMGNNVMIYLDDIQHTHPEFLQKFISLCDGQRRMEGVWRGRTRTYDLRGKKVAVVMAGNPYTESGEKFKIPDMLANRADTYNLGDILGGHEEAFELSYLENCLAVNTVLAPVATRSQNDFYCLLRIAAGDDNARSDLEYSYSGVEIEEIVKVLEHLKWIQGVLSRVNRRYIASASQSDDYRTEPPFKLQGSYRNMAKLAEKVAPLMNSDELRQLVVDHYASESQTLTSDAEANFLKLKEMVGALSPEETSRWEEIKSGFRRRREFAEGQEDPAAGVLMQFIRLNEQVQAMQQAFRASAEEPAATNGSEEWFGKLELAASRIEVVIARLGDKLDALGAGNGAGEPPKVEVINTLPRYYANLYKNHLELIKRSIEPMLSALSMQLRADKNLEKGLEKVAHSLERLLEAQEQYPLYAKRGKVVTDD